MKTKLLAVLILGASVSVPVFAGDAGTLQITATVATSQCTSTTVAHSSNPSVSALKSNAGFIDSVTLGFNECEANESVSLTATAQSSDTNIEVYLADTEAGLSTADTSTANFTIVTDESGSWNDGNLYYKLKASDNASAADLAGDKTISIAFVSEYN